MVEPTNHPARNEWERMLSGELYVADSPQQQEANMRKRRLVQAINTSEYDAFKERDELFHELFGAFGEGGFVEPPFNCDYGCNTFIGKNFYANMDCIFLDVARITIGDRVFFGPRVGLYTPYHPIDAAVRSSGPEGARPITIGNDVWFGGNVVVGPGITIGDDVVIGAGSVVVKDIPSHSVAVGNPCHVIREITDADRKAFQAFYFDTSMRKVTEALRKYDSNHLYLGCRFNQWNYELVNDEMFKTAGKYMDILSINHYQKWEPDAQAVQNWGAWSGKPFFVTEFYTKGEDSELPNTTGAGWNVRTQAERGYFYQNFVLKLIESKVCVGWHWFTYQDNDPENPNTDPSNRDSNKGMVTWDFQYYSPLLDNMEELNGNVYQLTRFYDAQ